MMKRFVLCCLLSVAASGVVAQEVAGVPAKLETANGKVVNSLLQGCSNGLLTFRLHRGKKEFTVPVSKVRKLTFVTKFDRARAKEAFDAADYGAAISVLEPALLPLKEYMVVDNDLRPAYRMLMLSYYGVGDFEKLNDAVKVVEGMNVPDYRTEAKVCSALVALAKDDVAAAEEIRSELEKSSPAAALYIKACTLRKKAAYRDAIWTATEVLAEHGNDLLWMPPTELLCARLYLDMGMTNSASLTARQVKHIYTGTRIAVEAKRMRDQLGIRDEDDVAEAQPAAPVADDAGTSTNVSDDVVSTKEEAKEEGKAAEGEPEAEE